MDGAWDCALETWSVFNDLHRAILSNLIHTFITQKMIISKLVINVLHVVVSIRLDLSTLSLPLCEVAVEEIDVRMAEGLEHECCS